MARNDHQREEGVSVHNNKQFPVLFAYFICGVELPALWMIVTEAIYDLRESHNCPRTFDTYFSTDCSKTLEVLSFLPITNAHVENRKSLPLGHLRRPPPIPPPMFLLMASSADWDLK